MENIRNKEKTFQVSTKKKIKPTKNEMVRKGKN